MESLDSKKMREAEGTGIDVSRPCVLIDSNSEKGMRFEFFQVVG